MWAERILFANAIWDIITGVGILIYVGTGRLKPLADLHLSLWVDDDDKNNDTASVLLGCLVLQWSWMRLITALDPVDHWQDAVSSYWLEGTLIGIATFIGRMHTVAGSMVVLLCAACAAAVLVEALG